MNLSWKFLFRLWTFGGPHALSLPRLFSQRFNLVVLFGRGFNRYVLKRKYVRWETKTIQLGQLQTLSCSWLFFSKVPSGQDWREGSQALSLI